MACRAARATASGVPRHSNSTGSRFPISIGLGNHRIVTIDMPGLKLRLGLARTRTAAYPMDSMDFVFSKTRTVALLLLGLGGNLDTTLAQELPVDMAPTMAESAGKAVPRDPFCELSKDTVTLSNPTLRCVFSTGDGRLTLRSLHNEFTTGEMLLQPGLPALFVVEANGRRFVGSRDFDLKSLASHRRQETGVILRFL